MPPTLALMAGLIFIAVFIWKDELGLKPSRALWIPTIWLMILSSRFISQWLGWGPALTSSDDLMEGSPVDRVVFLGLILVAAGVLVKRRLSLGDLIRRNPWVFLFLFYEAMSVCWADYPFVAFKRWVKEIGNFMIVLVVLTEEKPIFALRVVLRRYAYVLIPLSVVLIKYFPELGTSYSDWTGAKMFTGVSHNKNYLGLICITSGVFLLWDIILKKQEGGGWGRGRNIYLNAVILAMVFWLIYHANSATSSACLVVGVYVILATRTQSGRDRIRWLELPFMAGVTLMALNAFAAGFWGDFMGPVSSFFGRDETFTGRTELWKDILHMDFNPLIGAGYNSFWAGPRMARLWAKHTWMPFQAHNGYLEIYINLGLIGLSLLAAFILSVLKKVNRLIHSGDPFGRFQLAFLFVLLIYNITEAAFLGLHPIWFLFILIALEPARKESGASEPVWVEQGRGWENQVNQFS